MSKYKDADLILKLYDLRREKTMREARDWFFMFNPQGLQDFMDVLLSDKSAYYRMVVSYWEMACSLVNHGAIDSDMFADANGEHLFVYAKLEPFLPALREAMGNQQMLSNLEKVVKETPDYEEKLQMIRDRMQKFAELMKQRNAAQAVAASN
jgi:hypothetical protein